MSQNPYLALFQSIGDVVFTPKIAEQKTSETYKIQAKQFLEKLDLRIDCTASTYHILANIETFPLPQSGEQFRIRTQRQLNLIALILRILAVHQKLDEVFIATYTLNTEAYQILKELIISQRIQKLSLFLASSYSFRNPEYYERLKREMSALAQEYDVHLTFAWLHFKITLLKCGENYYQFEGSMNYSTNNMAEQLVFENSQTTYAYDKRFLETVLTNRNQQAIEIIC